MNRRKINTQQPTAREPTKKSSQKNDEIEPQIHTRNVNKKKSKKWEKYENEEPPIPR